MTQCTLHSISLPIGTFLLAEVNGSLCAMTTASHLPSLKKQLQRFLSDEISFEQNTTPLLQLAEEQLKEYFTGHRQSFNLPLTLCGSDFQQRVWKQLLNIPYGSTCSYGYIAKQLQQKGAQSVGTAVGKNPLPIIVPCHRVLPQNGTLGQFSMEGGPDVKAILLDLEGAHYKKQQ